MSNPFVQGDLVRIDFQSAKPGRRGPSYIQTVMEDRHDRFRVPLGWLKRVGPYYQDSSGQLALVTMSGSLRSFVRDAAEAEG